MKYNAFALLVALLVLAGSEAHGFERRDASAISRAEDDLLYTTVREPVEGVIAVNISSNSIQDPNFASYPGLTAPRGLFFKGNDLVVAFQNQGQPFPGDIVQFNKHTGAFKRILVPHADPEAPWSPRGVIWLPGNLLAVADIGDLTTTPNILGYVRIYNYSTGELLFKHRPPTSAIATFLPRGVVYKGGKLYVTSFAGDFPNNEGYISRFDPILGFEEVLVSHLDSPFYLHRPEGIVFGPDGNLWVAAFRASAGDFDRVLVYTVHGDFVRDIPLYKAGETRIFAQAIVFGSRNELYLGAVGTASVIGVKKYNLDTGLFSPVYDGIAPWYLAFKKTDPSSLAYRGGAA